MGMAVQAMVRSQKFTGIKIAQNTSIKATGIAAVLVFNKAGCPRALLFSLVRGTVCKP